MSLFQLGKKSDRKPLRLLVFGLVMTLLLSGCGASKYEAVDLSVPGSSAETAADVQNSAVETAAIEEKPAIVLGETGAGEQIAEAEAVTPVSESEERNMEYQDTDDYVIVTADILNVRAEDNTESRIYAQLPTGDHFSGENMGMPQIFCGTFHVARFHKIADHGGGNTLSIPHLLRNDHTGKTLPGAEIAQLFRVAFAPVAKMKVMATDKAHSTFGDQQLQKGLPRG